MNLSEEMLLMWERIRALEAHANAPTVDARENECPSPMDLANPHGHHTWKVLTDCGNPIGRECRTCKALQEGTMIWEPLPSAREEGDAP